MPKKTYHHIHVNPKRQNVQQSNVDCVEYNVQCRWCCCWELKKNLIGEWSTLHVTTTGNSKTIYWKISVRPPFLSLCDSYHHVYLWKQYDAIFRNIVIASVAYLQQRNDKVSSDCVREVRDDVAFHSLFCLSSSFIHSTCSQKRLMMVLMLMVWHDHIQVEYMWQKEGIGDLQKS